MGMHVVCCNEVQLKDQSDRFIHMAEDMIVCRLQALWVVLIMLAVMVLTPGSISA